LEESAHLFIMIFTSLVRPKNENLSSFKLFQTCIIIFFKMNECVRE